MAKGSAVEDRRYVHPGPARWNRKVSEEQQAQELERKKRKRKKKAQLFLKEKRKMSYCSIINGKQKRFYGLIEKQRVSIRKHISVFHDHKVSCLHNTDKEHKC